MTDLVILSWMEALGKAIARKIPAKPGFISVFRVITKPHILFTTMIDFFLCWVAPSTVILGVETCISLQLTFTQGQDP